MFKLALGSLVLLAALALPFQTSLLEVNHKALVDRVDDSIVRLSIIIKDEAGHPTDYNCTGFHIAPTRILTAAHCVEGPDLKANGELVVVVKQTPYYDLALLATTRERPPLPLRMAPVQRFESMKSLGYAYGWFVLTALDNKAFLVDHPLTPDSPVGIIVQNSFVGGMSGGPMIDLNGNVVGLIQKSNQDVGFGIGTLLIQAFLLGQDLGE